MGSNTQASTHTQEGHIETYYQRRIWNTVEYFRWSLSAFSR